ncbi:MAG TPA: DsbC family protein [Burkholderiales bacterium]|nr:DsbC family protein [Burkholderiales bacterium]
MQIKTLLTKTHLVLALLFFAHAAAADEASVRKAVQEKFPKANIESVTKTPYLGLYEVYMEKQLVYTDEKVNYFFLGSVVDGKTMQNLTEERTRKLNAIKFDSLPLELAIKIVKGNGKRKVAIFSDPFCPFCQRLEQSMAGVTDVTIYTFLYPIESLHPGATQKAKAIWCSPDRVKAWNDFMLKRIGPDAQPSCDTPVDKIVEYGRSKGFNGTPTLIFADGEVIPGAIPTARLEQMLDNTGTD